MFRALNEALLYGPAVFSPTCSFRSDQLAGLGETSRTRNATPQSDLAQGSKSQHVEEIPEFVQARSDHSDGTLLVSSVMFFNKLFIQLCF